MERIIEAIATCPECEDTRKVTATVWPDGFFQTSDIYHVCADGKTIGTCTLKSEVKKQEEAN